MCLIERIFLKMTNNQRILELISKRLEVGAKKYGNQVPVDGSRDNLKESIEELLDLCVYLSAVALELHEQYINNKRGE
ncbi:MAG: hypothetical protein CME98_08635 [Hyphomonas sp.]|nr:hypothetical protein [Hyphomonas sp.]